MNVVMVAMTTLFEHHLEMAFVGPLNTTSMFAEWHGNQLMMAKPKNPELYSLLEADFDELDCWGILKG
jgi:hypothetical protein